MKPFDLKAALAGAKVVSRNGVKILRVVPIPEGKRYQVAAVSEFGQEAFYPASGRYYGGSIDSPYDLIMYEEPKPEPVKRELFINVWQNEVSGCQYANVHTTREAADAERTKSCSNQQKILLGTFPFNFDTPTKTEPKGFFVTPLGLGKF